MGRIFLILTVCFAACSKKPSIPKSILQPEKMQAVYWDYIKADIFANEFVRRDTSKKLEVESAKLQEQVFKLHKTSKAEFYKSYEFYLDHRELLKDMLDTMLVRQKEKTDTSTIVTTNINIIKRDSFKFRPRIPDSVIVAP